MRQLFLAILVMFFNSTFAFGADVDSVAIKNLEAGLIAVELTGIDFSEADTNVFVIEGNHPRIVIDLKQSRSTLVSTGSYTKTFGKNIKAVRGATRDGGQIRFVVDLENGSYLKDLSVTSSRIIITVEYLHSERKSDVVMASVETTSTSTTNFIPVSAPDAPTPRIKPKRTPKPVIVIDAGHGGRDPGALGGSGLKEKTVTLKAAQELKSQLLSTGRYNVVLSRVDDRYVEHEDSVKLARIKNADLFISIHADATEGKSARGASVYTLADKAKSRSKGIVNSQNWIMDVDLSEQNSDVGNILVDLAQRNTASQSTKFADILIDNLGTTTPLIRNTHRRAGYYVLLAPDVPAVLLELGFISNPEDEKLLNSSRHRRKVMGTVTSAINQYFDTQKP